MSTDDANVLQQIERNTKELATWMKVLVGAIIVLVVLTVI